MHRTNTGLLRALGIDHHAWWGDLYEPHLGVVSHGTGKCPSPVFPRVHPDPNTSAVRSQAIVLV